MIWDITGLVVWAVRWREKRDDNGKRFGFGTHMYRHYYGVKLTEMHLDDFTIAKLLGHSSGNNVKYYRKMSNQVLADETRKIRHMLSEIILQNLDGWGQSMSKYEKMLALNKQASNDKIERARKVIIQTLVDGEKISISKLMKDTGLSRGFFYKNPTIRKLIDQVLEQQVGLANPRKKYWIWLWTIKLLPYNTNYMWYKKKKRSW